MEMLNKFNSCFPDSKYREISPYYSGDDHAKYQNSKSPINTKILTFDEIKSTSNRIGWIIPNNYIAIDLDDKVEAAKLYNILIFYKVNFVWMVSKHGGHFIFKNNGNYSQNVKLLTSIGLTIDIRSKEKGYIILPHNDPDRQWGTLSEKIDDLPFYLRPIKKLKMSCDLVDLAEGNRNTELLKHFLNLKDYADELSLEEKINSVKIINKFIFKEPLDEKELMNTVLRDEMINRPSLSDNPFKPTKRSVMLESVASKFCTNNKCICVNDSLYIYNGKYYELKTDSDIHRIIHEEYDCSLIDSDRVEILKFIKLKCYTKPEQINKNWNEIVVKNGILNLSNCKLYNHTSENYNTIYIDYNWNESVEYSPVIDSYMNQISGNDEYKKTFFYEMIGYCLLQKPVFAKMFILYGAGGTGKSTFLNLIKKLIGTKYCSYLSLSDLEKDFMPSELFGKLVNLGDDIDAKVLTDTGMLKSLISGETVNVRKIYKEPFSFNNFAKLIFTCNKLPIINDRTSGMYRRMCIIEISRKIEKFDPFFIFKITDSDMEYLLYKSIQALLNALENNKLSEDETMIKELERFKIEQSSVLSFIEDTAMDTSNLNLAPTQTVYEIYRDYCERNGYKALNRLNFCNEVCDNLHLVVTNTTKNGEKQCRRFKIND